MAVDALERGWSKGASIGWGIGIFLFCLPGILAYAFFRERAKPQTGHPVKLAVHPCRYCGKDIVGSPAFCPHCSAQLKGSDEIHRPSS